MVGEVGMFVFVAKKHICKIKTVHTKHMKTPGRGTNSLIVSLGISVKQFANLLGQGDCSRKHCCGNARDVISVTRTVSVKTD